MAVTDALALSSLKSYLETFALLRRGNHPEDWKYGGFEELVLNCGIAMDAKPLPRNIERGTPKQCYANCQRLAFRRKTLTYVEGYAVPALRTPMPIPHAWLLTAEGEAIDPTLETPGIIYLGVPLSTGWVKTFLAERQKRTKKDDISIFEGNILEDYSLLKEGLPPDATAL